MIIYFLINLFHWCFLSWHWVFLIHYLSRILVYSILYQLSLFRNSESCNAINVIFFLNKEKMLAMLSLLKKMTTYIITGINTLYFKSNYNMKKVLKTSYENHKKNLIKISKLTIKLLQYFWLTKDSILNVVNIILSIQCIFIYMHFINCSVQLCNILA